MSNERRAYDERGFTLIELMIVVAIIAILLPNFVNARAQAQTSACMSNIRSIATASELYFTDNQVYPTSGAVTPTIFTTNGTTYLNNSPHDPSAIVLTSTYTFTNAANSDGSPGYTIECPGAHPAATVQKIALQADNGGANVSTATAHEIWYSGGVGYGVDKAPAH